MGFFDRLSNGWKLSMSSFSVIKKNKQLLIFPVLSGAALLVLLGSFIGILYSMNGNNFDRVVDERSTTEYIGLFVFYLINYFIVIFFNMALIHCARIYFEGGKPTITDGLRFSLSRIGDILVWSTVAATVGLLLRMLEENGGKIGKIIASFIGIAWSITTFFVVPVLAYENLKPMQAYRRSVQIMREKWGESLGSGFSFSIIQVLGILIVGVPLFFIGSLISPIMAIVLAAIGVLCVIAVVSAAQTIFISAVYHHIDNKQLEDFNSDTLDSVFYQK